MRRESGSRAPTLTWRDPFRDEAGLTTVGMVLSLLITLSLVFSAGQVCRLSAASAEIQNVADASALAAENEVAEFMIVVRVCDAVVLSLSLASLAATGLGVAALCTPATATASEALLKAGREVARARDGFAEKAAAGLNRLQRLLPFLSAANAAAVASANNGSASNYVALAVLAPAKGDEIVVGAAEGLNEAQEAVDDQADEMRQAADKAEEAAQRANEAKMRAFEHDCGANPTYCMYERASTLAGMTGSHNPLFRSVDAWSFSVALDRAKAYYAQRLAQETPQESSVEEQVRSVLRARFYAFAVQEVGRGYVHETADSFDALFPRLPKNTAEMRTTELYTEAAYPFGIDEEGRTVMHAWKGCPSAANATDRGSIAQMEAGSYTTCEVCGFSASSMGKVAAASSSIENGFEYHYEEVAVAADEYEHARTELEPLAQEVKTQAGSLFDRVKEGLLHAGSMRIDARPPGGKGAVALVVNGGQMAAASGFESSFVHAGGVLGTRAAVSAATLVAEHSDEGSTVVSSLLDGIADHGGTLAGAGGLVLDCWSSLLSAYSDGQGALDDAVSSALDGLPLGGASGLGAWAAGALREVVAAVGLEPANLDALKPVLVNSGHVAAADDGAFSARLLSLKEQAVAHPLGSNDLFTSLVGAVEQGAVEGIQSFNGKVEIASIELLGEGGPSIPLEVSLPPAAKDAASDLVHRVADGVRSVYVGVTGVRIWE